MEKLVLEAIEKFKLLNNGVQEITIALSGGADSMALLYTLNSLKEKLNIKLSAAHLNHMIRGEEALRDEEFVKKQCELLDIPLFCERADIPKIAGEQAISTELAARKIRYEFLERVAKGVIATAHTASDNIETVIFNLSRGTALSGLCGIPYKRDRIIRPLILCTRTQIEEYCKEYNIPFVTDSTNLTDDYTRNKIRHNVVTVLKEINPSVEQSVLRMTENLREDADFLDGLAKKYVTENIDENGKLKLNGFSSLHISVAKRVVKIYAENVRNDISLENIHINAILAVILGGKTSIPKNCSAIVSDNKLCIKENEKSEENICFSVDFEECSIENVKKSEKINNLLLNNSIDCDKIKGKLVCRTRCAGDSIRLKNRGCTKSLNKIMSENKIPTELRDKLPVLQDDEGVVWVSDVGVAQRCAADSKTKRILKIKVKKIKEI